MIERLKSNRRMSQIVTFPMDGDIVILSGQVADTRTLDTAGQTQEVLAKIDSLLGEAGVTKNGVVSASIWLKDMADFDAMNEVWDAWVPEGYAPARACVQSTLAFAELLVEVQVSAVRAKA